MDGNKSLKVAALVAAILLVAGISSQSQAQRGAAIYVDANAQGPGDGSSWNSAFTSLTDALDAATSGDLIMVADGVYTPTGPGRDSTFLLDSNIVVRGGYAGFGAVNPNARDVAQFRSILSGDLLGDDGPSHLQTADNAYHVVTATGVGIAPVLDGFTITAGRADGSGTPPDTFDRGGGIYCDCRLAAIDCTFKRNYARKGGGMYGGPLTWVGAPSLLRCSFIHNSADEGGALWVGDCNPTMTDCSFFENKAEYNGGAIMFGNDNFTQMTGCLFVGNEAGERGGALYCTFTFNMRALDCTFSHNKAQYEGGAVFNDWDVSQRFSHCTFHRNEAWHTGGIFSAFQAPTIDSVILWENTDDRGMIETSQIDGVASPTIMNSCVQGWLGVVGGPDVIGGDPLFVGLGPHGDVYIDASNSGPGDGSLANPYPTIREVIGAEANWGWSLRLGDGSPCIGTGVNGTNMGADHGVGGATGAGPMTLFVAMGEYDLETCNFINHVSLIGPDYDIVTLVGTVRGLRTGAQLVDATITGAPQWGLDINLPESPDIRYVHTVENALGYGDGYSYAGGINVVANASPTLFDVWSDRNGGQGMIIGPGAAPRIHFSRFRDNGGRGIRSEGSSSATITRCRITGNRDGGVFFGPGCTSLIADTQISGNSAGSKGGGIESWFAEPRIYRSMILDNTAEEGGGVYIGWRSNVDMRNTLIARNEASLYGGGIAVWQYSVANILNSTIANNMGTMGMGMSVDSPLQDQQSTVTVKNSIFWDGTSEIDNIDGSEVSIDFSNVLGGWPGTSNLGIDPSFVSADDYRLAPGSTGVDSGDNASVPQDMTLDLALNPRIRNQIVDRGAYESQETQGPHELYVDDDAPGDPGPGDPAVSDPNEDGTPDHPFDLIAEALDVAVAGDTVRVLEGTYREVVAMKPGVDILGAGAEQTTIEGVSPQAVAMGAVVTGASNCRIDGFTIVGPGDDDVAGIYCTGVEGFAITRNIIRNHTWEGVFAAHSSIVVAGNLILDNRCAGVWVRGVSSEPSLIVGNTILGNQNEADLTVWESGSAFAANNILGDVDVANSSLELVRNNVVNMVVGGDNISMPPLFVNPPSDYRLRFDSPCVDAGSNADVPAILTTDLDGNPRIANGTVDMGAYEFSGPVPPERLFVDVDAAGANNGGSWTDAFNDLQDALSLAAGLGGIVNEIWVAEGTYTPSAQTDPADPCTATFELVDGVALYGGFAGVETELSQRDIAANETILNGDIAGDDGPNFANNDENSYHVVTADVTDPATILDGFTITGGNADGTWDLGAADGGGVYARDASITIAGCAFVRNAASDRAGALYQTGGTATVVDCLFEGNTAPSAGALDLWGPDSMILNSRFVCNVAQFAGGAACSDATFVNCEFCGNSAGWGGALFASGCDLAMINCTLHGNRADESGGALHFGVEVAGTICNAILWGNTAPIGAQIAVYNDHWETAVSITHCDIEGGEPGLYYHPNHPNPYTWGTGNMVADPRFVTPGAWVGDTWQEGDCRLQPGSPCVNAGANDALPDGVDTDLAGGPRILHDIVDMGAYETDVPPAIEASVRVLPRTLNKKSRGQWVTCWIELPQGYSPQDIDVASLLLNGEVAASNEPTAIEDPNENGIPELMVKFPRAEIIAIVEVGENVEMQVTGLVGGQPFSGVDHIRVVNPCLGHRVVPPGGLLVIDTSPIAEGLVGTIRFRGEYLPPGSLLDDTTGVFSWQVPDSSLEAAAIAEGDGGSPEVTTAQTMTVSFIAEGDDDDWVVETIDITVAFSSAVRPTRWTGYR